MAADVTGPGPANKAGFRKSWAQMVGSSLPSSWNKNILEVVLEKDERGPFNVSDTDCSQLLRRLGIDPRPGVQIQSVQICPTGRGVILITFKQGLNIDMFSRYDVFEVTKSGIRAVHVKPAGKRDVVVTIKGLHPNTRDDGVINYLSKYCKIVTNKVVYCTHGEGPLKGLQNGDRAYKVEVNADTNIGTYHAVDGQRVTLRYSGQLQTCARCHETALICKGGAIARKCEAAQGDKVEFSDYIIKLWEKIGYAPGEVEMAAVYDEHGDYDVGPDTVVQQTGGFFTPLKQKSEPEKYSGVSVKQFPKEADHGDIIEYFINAGLPEDLKDSVEIRANGKVTIKNLENAVCLELISNIHNKIEFGKKLFCNGFIALTPEKENDPDNDKTDKSDDTPSLDVNSTSQDQPTPVSTSGASMVVPKVLSPIASSPDFKGSHSDLFTPLSDVSLIRRHSIGIPPGSIASEILNTKKSLLTDIRDLQDQLSDFGSCVSTSDSSGEEGSGNKQGGKKKKRKAGKTPIKNDEKSKKANFDWFEGASGLSNQ